MHQTSHNYVFGFKQLEGKTGEIGSVSQSLAHIGVKTLHVLQPAELVSQELTLRRKEVVISLQNHTAKHLENLWVNAHAANTCWLHRTLLLFQKEMSDFDWISFTAARGYQHHPSTPTTDPLSFHTSYLPTISPFTPFFSLLCLLLPIIFQIHSPGFFKRNIKKLIYFSFCCWHLDCHLLHRSLNCYPITRVIDVHAVSWPHFGTGYKYNLLLVGEK